jgi:FSR family fosmidomycin resistance protein-like MFS transporter
VTGPVPDPRQRVWVPRIPRRLVLATLGHLVIDSYPALLFVLMPIFMGRLHFDFALAGLLSAALLVTSSITQPIFGYLQDRRPLLPLATVGLLVTGIAMALTGLAGGYAVLLLLVLIAGLGSAMFHPQAVSLAGHSMDDRGWAIAIFFTGGSTGTALMGLAIVPVVTVLGLHGTLTAVLPAALLAVAFWVSRRGWRTEVLARASLPTQASDVSSVAFPLAMLVVISVLRSALLVSYLTFIPTLVVEKGGNLGAGALALAAFLLAGAMGAFLGGIGAVHFGSVAIIVWSLVGGFAALVFAPLLSGAVLVAWLLVCGVFLFASEAQVTAQAQRLLPTRAGTASSLMMGVGLGVGNVGALATGALADHIGITTSLQLMSLLLLGAIAAAIMLVVGHPRTAVRVGA